MPNTIGLQPGFLAVRAFLYIIAWIAFSRVLVGKSRYQDQQNLSDSQLYVKTSILFLFVFAFTISMAGVHWIMALEPLWFSTIWGVYQFSGLIMGTIATIVVACILLRKLGPLDRYFRDDHLHDLGKLLIGFSWFDLYVMVFPPVTGNVPVFGLPEAASMLCVVALSGLLFVKAFAVANPVPINDPFLQESLHYHC